MKHEQYEKFRKISGGACILIIDEVSSLIVENLAVINYHLQQLYNNKKDFGGITVLLVGDFSQLPAIGNSLPSAALQIS